MAGLLSYVCSTFLYLLEAQSQAIDPSFLARALSRCVVCSRTSFVGVCRFSKSTSYTNRQTHYSSILLFWVICWHHRVLLRPWIARFCLRASRRFSNVNNALKSVRRPSFEHIKQHICLKHMSYKQEATYKHISRCSQALGRRIMCFEQVYTICSIDVFMLFIHVHV